MPVSFRCYQCSQVLRTGRAKAGSVVACPKCGAELVVPESAAKAPGSEDAGGASDPADVIRSAVVIRPVEESVASASVGSRKPARRGEPRPALEVPMPSFSEIADTTTASTPASAPDTSPPSPPSQPPAEANADFPEIHIEPQPILAKPSHARPSEYVMASRPRDVLLPRAAMVAWSLFAILGLFLAFMAGLLAGHFLWVVKVVKT